MTHDLIKTGDADSFPQIEDRNGQVVLDYCRRCGLAEIELAPSCGGLTAITITDADIDALWREACGPGGHTWANPDLMHLCTVATNRMRDFAPAEQAAARARCAEILNARAKEAM